MPARPELIEEIRAHTDLVRLIGDYLPLRKSGRRYTGLCPFHTEKTPSFSVNPEGQFFYCFGCKASGDAFDFVMRAEGLDFPSAAKLLAERAGLKWEAQTPEEEAREKRRAGLYKLNLIAAEVYRRALQAPRTGLEARQYLAQRGLDLTAAGRFRLGFAPSGGKMLVEIFRRHGIRLEEAAAAGLVSASGGGYIDRFRHRLVFPLIDPRERIVGFGGRLLGQGEPKYLNSAESELFSKGQFLYGLNLARESIRRSEQAVLVEGYFDLISMHLAGLTNVVASLGTALTERHAELLKRLCARIIIAYDGDRAGQMATVRGLAILQRAGLLVQVAQLPAGEDPDEMVRRQGGEALGSLIASALPLTDYLVGKALAESDLDSPEGRADAVRRCLPILAEVAAGAARDGYIRQVAQRARVHEDRVSADLISYLRTGRKASHNMDNGRQDSNTNRCEIRTVVVSLNPAEKEVLRAILKEYSHLARISQELKPEDFAYGPLREIYELILKAPAQISAAQIMSMISPEGQPVLTQLLAEDADDGGPPLNLQALPKCIARVKVGAIRRKLMEIEAELENLGAEAGQEKRISVCQQEQLDLLRQLDQYQRHAGFAGA